LEADRSATQAAQVGWQAWVKRSRRGPLRVAKLVDEDHENVRAPAPSPRARAGGSARRGASRRWGGVSGGLGDRAQPEPAADERAAADQPALQQGASIEVPMLVRVYGP